MKFIITKDYDEMSRIGAQMIIEQIKLKSNSILGLATGSTPVGMYEYLVDAYKKGLDFSGITTFNLDEYCGLSPEHTQSYRYFMDVHLFNHININRQNIHIPSGIAKDYKKECEDYDKSILNAGGIDLQVLGIGNNGHIGFNEPGDKLELYTHIAKLKEETVNANSRFFKSIDEVPRMAITMGLASIMSAKKIVLLASGLCKAKVIAEIAKPYISTNLPASLLHLHKDVTVIADRDAASLLEKD